MGITYPDLWTPSAASGQTRVVQGAGVTTWGSVTIENDTSVAVLVSNSCIPPTDQNSAWRVIPPGALVSLPLGTSGVAYRLAAAPAAGGAVQTVLDSDYTPAGGNTGSVNIGSGTVNVTGPVSIQTANGVNLSTVSGIAPGITIPLSPGANSGVLTMADGVGRLVLLNGAGSAVTVTVTGNTTGARYFRGAMGPNDVRSCAVAGVDSTHGASVDAAVTVSVTAAAFGTFYVSQSYAAPALTNDDLYPTSTVDALTTFDRNVWVNPVPGKNLVQLTSTVAGPTTLLAAPGVGSFYSLRTFLAVPRTIVAGNTFALQRPTGPVNILLYGSAGVPPMFDFGGWSLGSNEALQVAQVAPLAVWDVTLTYAVVST